MTVPPRSRWRSRSPIKSWVNRGEPRRRMLIAFDGGYHGDTLGAMSVGRGSQMFGAFKDLMCKVRVLPYPATFEGDDAVDEREAGALSAFEALLADHRQTHRGDDHRADDARGRPACASAARASSSAGRAWRARPKSWSFSMRWRPASGAPASCSPWSRPDVVPDLVCLSKGLTAGYMPLAATVVRDRLFDLFLEPRFRPRPAARPFLHRKSAGLFGGACSARPLRGRADDGADRGDQRAPPDHARACWLRGRT